MKRGLFLLFLSFFTFLCLEAGLRLLSYTHWDPPSRKIEILQGPNRFLEKDPRLGFKLNHGTFRLAFWEDNEVISHHSDKGRELNTNIDILEKPEIWLLGGSFTYGWGLSSEETFHGLLQSKFQDYRFRNFGVPAYGTLQSLIQLRQKLSSESLPAVVVLNYAYFHNQRNTCNLYWRKSISPHSVLKNISFPTRKAPGASSSKVLNHYPEISGMRTLAILNLVAKLRDHWDYDPKNDWLVTSEIINEIRNECESKGTTFLLCGIDSDEQTKKMLKEFEGEVSSVMIAPDLRKKEFTLYPHDSHPNGKANQVFAKNLSIYLEKNIFPGFLKKER